MRHSLADLPRHDVFPGFHGRFVHTPIGMTLAYWTIDAGAELPAHSHPHEQVVNLLDGELELTVDGVPHRLRAGDVLVIPGGAVHSGRCIAEVRVLDVFSPVREDYRALGADPFRRSLIALLTRRRDGSRRCRPRSSAKIPPEALPVRGGRRARLAAAGALAPGRPGHLRPADPRARRGRGRARRPARPRRRGRRARLRRRAARRDRRRMAGGRSPPGPGRCCSARPTTRRCSRRSPIRRRSSGRSATPASRARPAVALVGARNASALGCRMAGAARARARRAGPRRRLRPRPRHRRRRARGRARHRHRRGAGRRDRRDLPARERRPGRAHRRRGAARLRDADGPRAPRRRTSPGATASSPASRSAWW